MEKALREVDLAGVSGLRVRGKSTMKLFGLVKIPNRNLKGDIKKTCEYTRSRLENKEYRWYLNLLV